MAASFFDRCKSWFRSGSRNTCKTMNETVTESPQEAAQKRAQANSTSAFNWAVQEGDIAAVRDLVDKKKLINLDEIINKVPDEGLQVLILAVDNDQLEILKYFVEEKKADVNLLVHGQTPLSVAAERGYLEVFKYLVEHGANIDATKRLEKHPLVAAAGKGRLNIVKYLVEEKKVDVNVLDYWRHTALNAAIESQSGLVVRYLIDHGANTEDIVHSAAHFGNWEILRYMVEEKKADINKQDNLGDTPLHKVCRKGFYEMAKYLVHHGADTTIRNDLRALPADVAEYCEDFPLEKKVECNRIVKYLKALPKKRDRRSVPYFSPLSPQADDGPVAVICSRVKDFIALEGNTKRDYFPLAEPSQDIYSRVDNFLMLANACSRYFAGTSDYKAEYSRPVFQPSAAVIRREKEAFIMNSIAEEPNWD